LQGKKRACVLGWRGSISARTPKTNHMKKSTIELQKIGGSGGGMIIDAKGKTTLDLQKNCRIGKRNYRYQERFRNRYN
jgi:hypothetical protein